jgi:hypothetical protein
MEFKYLFILLLILTSCKSKNNTLFEFDPRNLIENKITLSEIADDISYIPLDSRYPLGLIYDNIEFVNNSIYLSVKDVGILSFNKEGKILRKIGSIGRGPGEFVYNFRFTVDEKTESVYVWDSNNIIKTYSKTGKFLRSFSLKQYGDYINAIKFINFKLFAFYSVEFENSEYKWITVDTLGNLIKKERRKTPAFSCNFGGGDGAYIFRNRISYWNSFIDTVFSILPDLTEEPSYIISPGEHRFPKSKNISPNEMLQYLSFTQIFESDRFLIFRYSYRGKNDFVLINKEERKSFLTNWEFDGSGGIHNDLDGGESFLPKAYFTEDGREYMAGLVFPYKLKIIVSSDEFRDFAPKYPEKKKRLEKLADSLNETENPILMLVRLKK